MRRGHVLAADGARRVRRSARRPASRIGLAVGWVVAELRKRLDDAPTETAVSLLTPYFAYLPAEALGVSAVLAAVTAGLYLGWRSPELVTPSTRIQARRLLGDPRLRAQRRALRARRPAAAHGASTASAGISTGELVGYAARGRRDGDRHALRVGLPVRPTCRGCWSRRRARTATPPDCRLTRRCWAGSGMRGAVSLAAALAIPLQTDAGEPFPGRDLIIFLAYAVILVTRGRRRG